MKRILAAILAIALAGGSLPLPTLGDSIRALPFVQANHERFAETFYAEAGTR